MILLLSCVIPKEVTGISFPGTAILLVSTNDDKILEESEKKENHIWLVEKTCPSYESYFANQKNCEDIDWNLTVHLSNLRVEMMRKKSLFWCEITKPRYNGILNGVFRKSFNLFFKDSFWIFHICKQLCCTTTKTTIYSTQAIYVVMTNECFSRGVLNK